MEGATDHGPASVGKILTDLSRAVAGPPDAAAARIEQTLRSAGAEGKGPSDSLEADEAVLTAVRQAGELDPILEAVPLDLLDELAGRFVERLSAAGPAPDEALRGSTWDLLDLIRRPAVLRRIPVEARAHWSARILALVDGSHFTVGPLFRTRADSYGSRPLFRVPSFRGGKSYSWRQTAARVEAVARGLLSLEIDGELTRVAILSENRIESVWVDLACLGAGIVNVPIPANATEADVGYILGHCGAEVIVVSDGEQLAKVLKNREGLARLAWIVSMNPAPGADGVVSLDEVAARAGRVPAEEVLRRSMAVRTDELATVMYSSGTTGTPKGIQFSHRNVVFKRFARALALPEIGEDDVFLCYLPLYHTFGRFLEMIGCIFWGSTYCFLDNPSVDALVEGMQRFRPTVFISVPRKWIQLHEAVTAIAHPDRDSDEEVDAAVKRVTGGRLRWGLSAAGHLDSEIFRFFQHHGTELMSGFGMTEATGGISMTPPGEYRDDSLGIPLPGIETRRLDDGELLVRGPYVMIGYLDPPEGESSFDAEGWLHTGDLMEEAPDGHLRLVDRKKEIYKNVKGETIAPQRVENLFRDFESVGRIFLVGDHRPYNTALIYPNPAYQALDLTALDPRDVKDHFRSLVVSVNKFLAPFERIVDFAVIPRDLDPEKGELTPKGTPRRKTVETHFEDTIRLLYRRTSLRVGEADLTIPNWLFQALGLTAHDIDVEGDGIRIRTSERTLTVRDEGEACVRIGSCRYRHPAGPVNLGDVLAAPRLWLGNEELVEFADIDLRGRERPRTGKGIVWAGRVEPPRLDRTQLRRLDDAGRHPSQDLLDLHIAAQAIHADPGPASKAVRALETVLGEEENAMAEPARVVLSRAVDNPSVEVRRLAFQVLVQAEKPSRFRTTLESFMLAPGVLLDDETRALVCERTLSDDKLDAFVAAAGETCSLEQTDADVDRRASSLLRFLAEYGTGHPTQYRRLRAFLVRTALFTGRASVRDVALAAAESLRDGFRRWLGPTQRIAVDPETGHEYRWQDVVTFDESVDEPDRSRLLSAIRGTSVLREAIFLFSKGTTVRLSDIPPGGVWIRHLGTSHGKAVHRITIQTRFQGSFDVAVNVNHELGRDAVREEIQWLILCGDSDVGEPLVEDYGGYWDSQDLWSEEFIPGPTLDVILKKMSRKEAEAERLRQTWPFYAWSAISAYIDFWNRTGRRQEIAEPRTESIIVPTHDYQTGARIVSVSGRKTHGGLIAMLETLRSRLVQPTEREYPALEGVVGWDVVFSSLLEIVGEDEGIKMLLEAVASEENALNEELETALDRYLARVEGQGFLPNRLFFAAKRYHRWLKLTVDPTSQARAVTMQELYDTYGLERLAQAYPEARVRFFRETVFSDAPEPLSEGLAEITARMRRRELTPDDLIDAVADLRARLSLESDDDYFLARLPFPHLRPEDAAGFVQADLGGRHQSEMVVSLEDHEGEPFLVRHALNPKEIGRLHRLFLEANLDVRFRPEHQYLAALNERMQIIGGIYYEVEEGGNAAHLEKIVVAERYRKKGVAHGLMNEFFNRLKAAGIKAVTTGFYRPEYFYAFGFSIEKRYAGLVKSLEAE